MSELTEDEVREPTLTYVAKLEARIEELEAALKEAGEMWVRKDNRIEALEAALAQVAELTNASKNTTCNTCRMAGVVARAALAPEQDK